MVQHYANLADAVLVYISSPKSAKSQRDIGGHVVTPQMSKELWERFVDGMPNVEVIVSAAPSPFTVLYAMTSAKESPLPAGTQVYFGASAKGGDSKRFSGVVSKADPGLVVMDPEEHAAPAHRAEAERDAERGGGDKRPSRRHRQHQEERRRPGPGEPAQHASRRPGVGPPAPEDPPGDAGEHDR